MKMTPKEAYERFKGLMISYEGFSCFPKWIKPFEFDDHLGMIADDNLGNRSNWKLTWDWYRCDKDGKRLEIEVGDEVECIDSCCSITKGARYIIDQIIDESLFLKDRSPMYNKNSFILIRKSYEIEKKEEQMFPKTKFKIGDKVISKNRPEYGPGEIVGIDHGGPSYYAIETIVKTYSKCSFYGKPEGRPFKQNYGYWASDNNLELYQEEPKQYRIKTEEEFRQEFGEDWRHHMYLCCSWVNPEMNYLFGNNVKSKNLHFVDGWVITTEMITDKPLPNKQKGGIINIDILDDIIGSLTKKNKNQQEENDMYNVKCYAEIICQKGLDWAEKNIFRKAKKVQAQIEANADRINEILADEFWTAGKIPTAKRVVEVNDQIEKEKKEAEKAEKK